MRPLLIICLAACCMLAQGQARNNNWIFGSYWLSFNNDTATLLPTVYHPSFRTASISSTAGDLLLLVDDSGIRDTTFNLMPGGAATDLGYSGEQGNYLILPKPGNPQRYVVLANSREDQKRAGAAEVDMSLNGGLGAVSTPLYWYMDSATAKLAATPHGNGTDYWILNHEDGTDEFHAYQLTAAGIAPDPVISHAGTAFQPSPNSAANADHWGSLKFNVQGTMIAMANMDPLTADTATTQIQLFSFDDLSGTVTHLASLDHRFTHVEIDDTLVYYNYERQTGGIEFDPSGTHLYSYTWDTLPPWESAGTFQCDLDVLDADSIQASNTDMNGRTYVTYCHDARGSWYQLAPNGRIFFRYKAIPTSWGYFVNLPYILDSVQVHWELFPFVPDDSTGGFPNFCKRYHDSEPVWLGVAALQTQHSVFGVWPNPVSDVAYFTVSGTREPDHVVWVDAVGRAVRTERVHATMGTVLLHCGDLPHGLYTIEARHKNASLGRARVLVQ